MTWSDHVVIIFNGVEFIHRWIAPPPIGVSHNANATAPCKIIRCSRPFHAAPWILRLGPTWSIDVCAWAFTVKANPHEFIEVPACNGRGRVVEIVVKICQIKLRRIDPRLFIQLACQVKRDLRVLPQAGRASRELHCDDICCQPSRSCDSALPDRTKPCILHCHERSSRHWIHVAPFRQLQDVLDFGEIIGCTCRIRPHARRYYLICGSHVIRHDFDVLSLLADVPRLNPNRLWKLIHI